MGTRRECEIEGCRNEAADGRRFCPICDQDATILKGWAIYNTGANGLGVGEYEVQRDDDSTLFGNDEEAAHAHFEVVEVRKVSCYENDGIGSFSYIVVASKPRTPEAVLAAGAWW